MTKVLLECEECGHRWEPSEVRHYVAKREWWADAEPCPKCNPPEPTYGPITEEMVAEMLFRSVGGEHWDATGESYYGSELHCEARAVIRLLQEVRPMGPSLMLHNGDAVTWHAKLRDLAKEQ